MIAEINPEWYDVEGRKVFRPDSRRHSKFKPTFPMGRYLSQPLTHRCSDIGEIRRFLAGCKYVSDEEQFGERDYWQPPDQFETARKGDCEDFAIWTWRQLMHVGYPARFVVGTASRYGDGHAWLTFELDGKTYLLESLSSGLGLKVPRLSVLQYKPRFSVSWDGDKISYYEHEDRKIAPSLQQIAVLIGEWLFFWTSFWVKFVLRLPRKLLKSLAR